MLNVKRQTNLEEGAFCIKRALDLNLQSLNMTTVNYIQQCDSYQHKTNVISLSFLQDVVFSSVLQSHFVIKLVN